MNVRLNDNQKVRKINHSKAMFEIMHSILMRENKYRRIQEHFWIIGLNNANDILFVELVCLGADNKVMVSPREVFRLAILKLAQSIIIVHNHPSEQNTPSKSDNEITDFYVRIGSFMNVTVLDHLIITENNGYYSYADKGNIRTYNHTKELDGFDFEKERESLIYNHFKEKIIFDTKNKIATEFLKTKTPVKRISEITGVEKNVLKQMKKTLL